jgi:hypothetical protein
LSNLFLTKLGGDPFVALREQGAGLQRVDSSHYLALSRERNTEMPAFMGEWWFMALMVVILLGLIGLLIFLRNKRSEDD